MKVALLALAVSALAVLPATAQNSAKSGKPGASAKSAAAAKSAASVKEVQVKGSSYFASSKIPALVPGTYLYEKKGDPKIVLNADGTGSFEPHQRPGIPIKYWMQAEKNGTLYKESGQGNANYRHILVLQYGPGGGGNYPEGGYDRFQWTWLADDNCALILGERWKC